MAERRAVARPTRVAVVTVGRSDFSILRPLCRRLVEATEFETGLWVGGAHFDPQSGMTVGDVRASGLPVWAEIDAQPEDRTPEGAARVMAGQMRGVAAAALRDRPDLVLILGDRYEAVAAGVALVPFNIPIGHISGGSITEGAIDDVFRHCLTKMAALHFCEIPEFARRIHQMGEPANRIFTVGALGLDGIRERPARSLAELCARFGLGGDLGAGYALATLHSETRSLAITDRMAAAMVAALEAAGLPVIYTYPNADPHADRIVAAIEAAAARNPHHHVVRNFGADWFYTAMANAGLVIGNSSSGIIEAASFRLPVVDIGDRQKGRFHGANVLHAAPDRDAILAAITEARDPAMAARLAAFENPYGDGRSTERIVAVLSSGDVGTWGAPKPFCGPDPLYTGERRAVA